MNFQGLSWVLIASGVVSLFEGFTNGPFDLVILGAFLSVAGIFLNALNLALVLLVEIRNAVNNDNQKT